MIDKEEENNQWGKGGRPTFEEGVTGGRRLQGGGGNGIGGRLRI